MAAAAAPVMAAEYPPFQRPLNRNPNYQRVRDQLGKLTRLGSVLNYSDEQSSNNEEDDEVQPASSVSLTSPSPEHGFIPTPAAHPDASACSGLSALDRTLDLKATLADSQSASDAALAFQRWRISSLKALFTQELKKVLHEAQQDEVRLLALEGEMEKKENHLVRALADSAQLRAQLCALENVNGQHHGSSDVEVLQMDLMKALERATSSEAEVERYNKEIRKLRERLKSMEDEASRLDSELKASVSFLQKEKDGIAKENQVLLEQLARKDEEVLTQTQEINNLKSVLTCLRVSRLELERLKTELQGNAAQQGNKLDYHSSKVSVPELRIDVGEQSTPSGFSQLLELLQKLTTCLQKNEAYLDPCAVKVTENEERCALRPNLLQKEGTCLDAAADCKPISCAGQASSLEQMVNNCFKKGFESSPTTNASGKLKERFTVTCWKWRWVVAASEVQELSRELNTLKSIGKDFLDKTVLFQGSSFTSYLEDFRSSFFKGSLQNTEHPRVDLQAPLTFEKVFTLLTSIWKVSSQSAHQEKEAYVKNRQIGHLLKVLTRWMQRASKKRQLERVIAHWLRYLLQSWKDKFKHQNINRMIGMAPMLDTRLAVSRMRNPSHLKQWSSHNLLKPSTGSVVHIQSNLKERDVEICSRSIKTEKDAGTFGENALKALQDSLHHRLGALEALIIKEANSWHQQRLGDKCCAHKPTGESVNLSLASTNLVWKICCELEHCFFETRNQIMIFFGVLSKIPSCVYPESDNNRDPKNRIKASSPKPVAGQMKTNVGSIKKPVQRYSTSVQWH